MSDTTEDGGNLDINCIGIIGAGQMGGGIAHVCAIAGFDVKLSDISEDQLAKARDTIGRNMARQVKNDRISAADQKAALAACGSFAEDSEEIEPEIRRLITNDISPDDKVLLSIEI